MFFNYNSKLASASAINFFAPKTVTINGRKLKEHGYFRFGNDYIDYTKDKISIHMFGRTINLNWYSEYLEVADFEKGVFQYNPIGDTVFYNNLEMSLHLLKGEGLRLDGLKINFNARRKSLTLKVFDYIPPSRPLARMSDLRNNSKD